MSFNKSKFNNDRSTIFESKVTDKTLVQRNKLKTQMCKSMMTTGRCPFGEKCNFAHSQSEIRKPVCFFGDNCKNKESCGYDHSTIEVPELPFIEKSVKVETQEINPEEPKRERVKTQMCKSIASGVKCIYGERCTFAHSKEELGTPIVIIKKEIKPEDDIKVHLTPEVKDSFILNGESDELLELKKMFDKVEKDSSDYLYLLEEMKKFLSNTFNRDNTHYIPSTSNKSKVKFIAVECDDEDFQELKNVIKEHWL